MRTARLATDIIIKVTTGGTWPDRNRFTDRQLEPSPPLAIR